MRPIQSIICYNGGAGGDFLKAICCQQLLSKKQFQKCTIEKGMTVFDDHYFKRYCEKHYSSWQQPQVPSSLDLTKTDLVENTHHFHKWFESLTPNIYFIDHPDDFIDNMIKIYVQKRHNNSLKTAINFHAISLPAWAQTKLTENNFSQIFSIMWMRQLKDWRKTAGLKRIDIKDFFDPHKLQKIVETLIGGPITDTTQFKQFSTKWIDSNSAIKDAVF